MNNGVSYRSGYVGMRPPSTGGEVQLAMRRKDGRDGDPICYGDVNVLLEALTSLDDNLTTYTSSKYLGRISNYRKHNSKTDGGYMISGTTTTSSGDSKKLVFRIDGETVWSGLDLTKHYTLRATNCVDAPRRRKTNGDYGSTGMF